MREDRVEDPLRQSPSLTSQSIVHAEFDLDWLERELGVVEPKGMQPGLRVLSQLATSSRLEI